jgi:hypothetical protein
MNIYAPKVVQHGGRTTSQIVVNFFIGSAEDKLVYRIDNGEWRNMSYIQAIDPSYYIKLMEWDFTEELIPGRRPSNPVTSTHIWAGPLNLNLPGDEHTIEVKATDRFGKTHLGKKNYTILE